MAGPDYTYILDEDFPTIARERLRPSADRVAAQTYTRTVDDSGDPQGRYTQTTIPSLPQVDVLIDQAIELILIELPDYVPVSTYPRITEAVVCKTAVLIERSFFREQFMKGSAQGFQDDYQTMIDSIQSIAGGSGKGQRVDSIMGRSTMAEYDPSLPIPPPRVMPRQPYPINGDPYSESQ